MIADEYLVNWMVDNLPAATRYRQTGAPGSRSAVPGKAKPDKHIVVGVSACILQDSSTADIGYYS